MITFLGADNEIQVNSYYDDDFDGFNDLFGDRDKTKAALGIEKKYIPNFPEKIQIRENFFQMLDHNKIEEERLVCTGSY
jgi:hypothetical protein